MGSESIGAVQRTLTELITFLDALATSDSQERALAARAAVNIRMTLAALSQAVDAAALREVFKQAWYDTSDRGIFEWAWSPTTEQQLRAYAESIGRALDRADRWARRHPTSSRS